MKSFPDISQICARCIWGKMGVWYSLLINRGSNVHCKAWERCDVTSAEARRQTVVQWKLPKLSGVSDIGGRKVWDVVPA